jgi:hypothetical protein
MFSVISSELALMPGAAGRCTFGDLDVERARDPRSFPRFNLVTVRTDTHRTCPQCLKRVPKEEIMSSGCPWCGFMTAQAIKAKTSV